jgi:hypothetical protein
MKELFRNRFSLPHLHTQVNSLQKLIYFSVNFPSKGRDKKNKKAGLIWHYFMGIKFKRPLF